MEYYYYYYSSGDDERDYYDGTYVDKCNIYGAIMGVINERF